MIRSGSVFVFDEQESGIRRWTDGKAWSPSRVFGNFLLYRELEERNSANVMECDINQGYKYIFAHNGLVKKTISFVIDGHTHHLVCYYSVQDVCCKDNQRFNLELHKEMENTLVPIELLVNQRFRKPEAVLPFPADLYPTFRRGNAIFPSTHITHLRHNRPIFFGPISPALSVASMIQSPVHPSQSCDFVMIPSTPTSLPPDLVHDINDHSCSFYGIDTDYPQDDSSQTMFMNDSLQFVEDHNISLPPFEWTTTQL